MKSETLKDLAIEALDDMKGQDISCLNVIGMTSVCDYMIVVTGTSNRHLNSLTDELTKRVKEAGSTIYGVEGQNQAEWILLDLGDVVVHAMLAATRKLYDLEALWSITADRSE